MTFLLPKLRMGDRIVDGKGQVAAFFLRFLNVDFAGAIERQEAAQAATDARQDAADAAILAAQADIVATQAALQAQVDALAAVLDGTTPFTGLNVGGDDKTLILAKATAGVLDDPTALGAEVVETAAVKPNDITDSINAYTAADISLDGTTEVVAQTGSLVSTGKGIELYAQAQAAVRAPLADPFVITANLYRDGVSITSVGYLSVERAGEQFFSGVLGPLAIDDTPGAGEVDYELRVVLDITTATTDVVFNRYLRAREYRTEG